MADDGPDRPILEGGGQGDGWIGDDGTSTAATLSAFAKNPLGFLRGRVIPPILGAIFGFVFDLADIIDQTFDTLIDSLTLVSDSISNATGSLTQPIGDALAGGAGLVLSITAPLGPLQPFAATALTLAIAYGVLVLSLRLLRALADSIPVVSGIETFLFG